MPPLNGLFRLFRSTTSYRYCEHVVQPDKEAIMNIPVALASAESILHTLLANLVPFIQRWGSSSSDGGN